MKIDVKTIIMRPDGHVFQTVVGRDPHGQPLAGDLSLGLLLVDALSVAASRQSLTAAEMVGRAILSQRIYGALCADCGELSLSSSDVGTLKTQIELLQAERGYNVLACAMALMLIAPDDFSEV